MSNMKHKLTEEHIERMRSRLSRSIDRAEIVFDKLLKEEKYSFLSGSISDHSSKFIQMSMISYRIDNDILESKRYLDDAQNLVKRMQGLHKALELLENVEAGKDPNCIHPESLEIPVFLSLINRQLDDVNSLQTIYESVITNKDGGFIFAQQYSPILMIGALDQKDAFHNAYKTFREFKKSYFEQGLSLYIDMLAAIIDRDQEKFDELHLSAESAMHDHATDNKWGDDVMTGGHEYNVLAYDYRGTAMCCLAHLRGMQINHFSSYYPKEIICAD